MTIWSVVTTSVACGFVLIGSARADDQDVIAYRRHIMKTLGEQALALDMMIQQRVPNDNFQKHLQIIALTVGTAKKAFEPRVVGGRAKAAVWDQWADFSKRLDELTAISMELAKTAKTVAD